MKIVEEKRIFVAYEVVLLLKATQAFLEIVAGALLYAITTSKALAFILAVAQEELTETPSDFLSNFLTTSAHQMSGSGKFFIIFYLLSHGIIKLVLIIGLFLKKSWAYPASLIGLGGLILYQIYRLITGHSIALLILTIMDIVILWLIWREHRVQPLLAE